MHRPSLFVYLSACACLYLGVTTYGRTEFKVHGFFRLQVSSAYRYRHNRITIQSLGQYRKKFCNLLSEISNYTPPSNDIATTQLIQSTLGLVGAWEQSYYTACMFCRTVFILNFVFRLSIV